MIKGRWFGNWVRFLQTYLQGKTRSKIEVTLAAWLSIGSKLLKDVSRARDKCKTEVDIHRLEHTKGMGIAILSGKTIDVYSVFIHLF